jgi:hypothetical protein
MTSGYLPGPHGSPFDDFFARYMGGARQPRQRVDITQFLSEQAREVVNSAARRAAEVGSPDLDTDHLLWAMTEDQSTRQLISRAGVDPAQLRAELEGPTQRGETRAETPALTPAAKRALLDAHQISRALGSTYIGPEHRQVGPLGGVGRPVAHLLLALRSGDQLEAGRPLGTQPPAGDRGAGVALDLHDAPGVGVDELGAADRAVGADRPRGFPRRVGAGAQGLGPRGLRRGTTAQPVGSGQLPVDGPGLEPPPKAPLDRVAAHRPPQPGLRGPAAVQQISVSPGLIRARPMDGGHR